MTGKNETGQDLLSARKAELHCHIDGLIGPRMLEDLGDQAAGWNTDAEALRELVPTSSMRLWLDYLALAARWTHPPERFIPCLEIHIRNLIEQSVVYAEIMVSHMLFPSESEQQVIGRLTALRQAADKAAKDAIKIGFVVAIGRGTREKAEKQAGRILALKREGLISGVAVAGDENACSIESMADLLAQFRGAGLGLEIHAGEMAGPESVWEALKHGMPDRIGHGVRAFEDERLVEELRARDIHLEFCPTSNLCLGSVRDLREHPIARARKLGMNFSVNTDDPGPFDCSLVSEFKLLERELGFEARDFENILKNTLRSRFAYKDLNL